MLTAFLMMVVTTVLIVLLLKPRRPSNFPPGPPSYPIIGSGLYLSTLGDLSFEVFQKLGEIFGPVTGLQLGTTRAIIINGYEASKEFYAQDNFIARPYSAFVGTHWGGRLLGVFFSSGKLWQEQKRYVLRHLRDFGFGKKTMEGLIHEETEECIRSIQKAVDQSKDSVIEVHDKFSLSVINILWAIMAGKRYNHEDKEFLHLLDIVKESFRAGNLIGITQGLLNKYYFLRHLPYFKGELEKVTSGTVEVLKMLEKTIAEHEKTIDLDGEPRDLIDVYLKAMNEKKGDPDSTFFRDQLMQICSDLFSAGSESTSNSIAFAVLHVLRNPECQAKLHKELDDVIGRERLPSYEDRAILPYTFACVTEAFRMSPVAPVSVPHMNTEDVKFRGYNIPKNTSALIIYPSTNMEKSYWGDPEVFRPERFLDQNGQFIKAKLDHVTGFGTGKRICLGEPLARISNFILFTAVMQRFKFDLVPGEEIPTIKPIDGFTIAPYPFSAKVTARY